MKTELFQHSTGTETILLVIPKITAIYKKSEGSTVYLDGGTHYYVHDEESITELIKALEHYYYYYN